MSSTKKITFLYQEDGENKINLIQNLAHVWQERADKGPLYDEELEWARCLVQRREHFTGDMLFNRPSLVGAITVMSTNDDIVWLEDAGPHRKTTAFERDKVINRSYERASE